MFRLTMTTMWANKIRFALTTFGVTLAVSFVVGAFVLGDGLRASFADVSTEITAGIDLEVRNSADFGDPPPLPTGTVAVVAGVDGVADAAASIESADNAVRPIPPDGTLIPTSGPPQLAFNWIDNPDLSPFTLVEGQPPRVGEFTMDVDSAAEYGFEIGHTYEFLVPDGRTQLTMSGTSSFGADNSTLGAVLMQMNTAQASELFAIDGIDKVVVQLADGADPTAVQTAVRSAVTGMVPGADVVDHSTVLAETTSDFTREIDIVGNILLGFGGVALFVSIFIIYNTFSIVLGQRTRELALLRTLGAEPKQIRRSVLAEGLVVGVVASAGGIGGGIGVAKGIDALFRLMGVDLVDYPLILATRTLVAAAVVGCGVTTLAAAGPARRAAIIPPIAALVGRTDADVAGSPRRRLAGVVLIGVGLVAGATGLGGVGSNSLTAAALAAGAIAVILGVTVLSPLAVGRVTKLLGWPMRRVGGVAGRLAQRNAARNPRRTATTAAALMIGLTLVATALVTGASVKATIGSTIRDAARADYYLSDDLEDVQFPAALTDELRRSDVVATAVPFTFVEARIDGTVTEAVGFDFEQVDSALDLGIVAGGFDRSTDRPLVMSTDEAKSTGARIGDRVSVEFANGSRLDTTVVGLFDDHGLLGARYLFDTSVLADAGIDRSAEMIAVSIADGAPPAAVDALLADLATDYPQANIETADQYRRRVEGLVDGVLTMVNLMVALAVIIALIGIANTLALSVFERTRELGLVRAVGMTGRQVRRMVRLEAALVAMFGAVLGVGLGVLFGFGVVNALPASFGSQLSIPIAPIAALVLIAALAGVTAAWLPARRASRLDVLDAIAS